MGYSEFCKLNEEEEAVLIELCGSGTEKPGIQAWILTGHNDKSNHKTC